MPDVWEGRLFNEPGGEEELGKHDCRPFRKYGVFLPWPVQQGDGRGKHIFFTVLPYKGVKGMDWDVRVNDEDGAKSAAVASCLIEKVPFNIIDDNGVASGQELAHRKEPLSAACWRVNEDIPDFPPVWRWGHLENAVEAILPNKQTGIQKPFMGNAI